MPFYEYSCKQCGHVFEYFKKAGSNDTQVACPKCGEKHSKRIYSIFNSISKNCIPRFSGG
ncbi:MAG: zinc ribbon domain-containing protein [Dehalococcoidia bacterium]|nr:MAG: zinc ribbon domain-containing protein [Dehalococcoidia bacterium]